jgi:hypothetical protein
MCAQTTVGNQCKPTCDGTHGDCDGNGADGCETNFSTGGACACDACHVDCDGNAANGCESNACGDVEEPNDTGCGIGLVPTGATGLDENTSMSWFARLEPTGDVDIYHVHMHEVPHFCLGGSQAFCAEVRLLDRPDATLTNVTACGSPTQSAASTATDLIIKWDGACFVNDDRDVTVKVSGPPSCTQYDLQFTFYAVDTVCP